VERATKGKSLIREKWISACGGNSPTAFCIIIIYDKLYVNA
jgi:hypothetical protein